MNSPQEGDKINCSCGAEIGMLIMVRGQLWLSTGPVTLRNGHGRCNQCSHIWHFNSTDLQLNLLVKHVMSLR